MKQKAKRLLSAMSAAYHWARGFQEAGNGSLLAAAMGGCRFAGVPWAVPVILVLRWRRGESHGN